MNRYLWLTGLLITAGSSCQKDTVPATDTSVAAVIKTNVAYGSDPLQKMDVYLPSSRSADTTKSIILIHGGGWTDGDKADFSPYVVQLQQKLPGYAVFNVNYRLAANGSNLFPAQENDIKAAVEFIHGKRAEYNIADKFVFLGASAGGHLALLQGYKYHSPVKPKAIVSFFGPTDLTTLAATSPLAGMILTQVTGATAAMNPTLYQQSSPATFVNAQIPPTMLLQGGADPLVPVAQSETLRNKLSTAGVPNEYVFYPTQSHGWTGDSLTDSFNKIAAFLKVHVQ